LNSSPEERAKALLPLLSPEEKLAQIIGWLPKQNVTEDEIAEHCAYGIGQISTLQVRSMTTLEEAVQWQRKLQEKIMALSPHHIPAIFHMEGVCGAFLQGAASFPCNMARGAGWDPETEEAIGHIVAKQHRAAGITQTLAPVLDIAHDPRLGRYAESYSEDPTLVAALGTAYAKGVQKDDESPLHSEGVAKHFVGSHHVAGGIHGAHAEIPPRLMREIYAKPFQAAFALANLRGVMPCYCVVDGEPSSASKTILTKLLRDEMGFDGVCVSDYSAVHNVMAAQHAASSKEEAGLRSLMAGMDVELPNGDCFTEDLLHHPEAQARIDEAVLRVLTAKFRMGLFEHPFALSEDARKEAFAEENIRPTVTKAAHQGIVLLKNNDILPLRKKRVAVIGCHAENPRIFFGDYTHLSMSSAVLAVRNSIAGIGDSATQGNSRARMIPGSPVQSDETEEFQTLLKHQKPSMMTLLDALCAAMPECTFISAYGYPPHGEDSSRYQEALDAITQADAAIVTLGGRYGSCSIATTGEGVDATNINLPLCQTRFLREAAKLGKPMIGLHFDGRPLSDDTADACCDALVECWALAEGGPKAVADVVAGKFNPCGKMPVSVPRCAGQIPVYYNHPWGSCWHQGESIGFPNYVDMPHEPRYPFGYGLSYTTFAYSDLAVSSQTLPADGCIHVSCTVKNTGEWEGTEVAQLYFSDFYASMVRPVKELAGFARVTLQPGECKRVTWRFPASLTAFLDEDRYWRVEAGEIQLSVGTSSEEISLTSSVCIPQTMLVDGRTRAFWAESMVEV
jgi:beta-glucosidase